MKKQSSYSKMKEKVGMHDYDKGKKAGEKKEKNMIKHPSGKSAKDYPMH